MRTNDLILATSVKMHGCVHCAIFIFIKMKKKHASCCFLKMYKFAFSKCAFQLFRLRMSLVKQGHRPGTQKTTDMYTQSARAVYPRQLNRRQLRNYDSTVAFYFNRLGINNRWRTTTHWVASVYSNCFLEIWHEHVNSYICKTAAESWFWLKINWWILFYSFFFKSSGCFVCGIWL